jgi:hypothetical protein
MSPGNDKQQLEQLAAYFKKLSGSLTGVSL